jgi:hypothetical protein
MPAKIDEFYNALVGYIAKLEARFVAIHIPTNPSDTPDKYELDVRAYCVLAHAAFEDFVERVALRVVNSAYDAWLTKRQINNVLLLLLAWSGQKLKIDDDDKNPETTCFDYLRPILEEAKDAFARAIHNNHGVSKLYLRELLTPASINLSNDPNWQNALGKLAEGRGEYAHKGTVKKVMSPEDSKKHVNDVLALCKDIRDKAKTNII